MKSLIIGTAGHVDHGKTTLIKNLTGIDTDRLKEEKERGLTIDIGFAFLGENISFIDVPGHEKFIKNMVAGAATINFAILVIAADDGIMPQTIEHYEILKFMGIQQGIIVLTKIDLVDDALLVQRKQEIYDFFNNSFLVNNSIFEVSVKNDEKINKLKSFLLLLPEGQKSINQKQPFRMPIDRVFSAKGFGTIITGTVVSGELDEYSSHLMIYPEKIPVKIRSIESQNQTVNQIHKNQRCAINLQSFDKNQIYRGQTLAEVGLFRPTQIITCSIKKIPNQPNLKYGEYVKFHTNTLEVKARMRIIGHNSLPENETAIVQFDLEIPICVGFQDKFIVRKLSPAETVAGGLVLDIFAPKIKKTNIQYIDKYLQLITQNLKNNITNLLNIYQFQSCKNLSIKLSQYSTTVNDLLLELITEKKLISTGKYYLSYYQFEILKNRLLSIFESKKNSNKLFHGIKKTELMNSMNTNQKLFKELINYLIEGKIIVNKNEIIFLEETKEEYKDSVYIIKIEKHILSQGYKLQNFKQLKESINIDKKILQDAINYLKYTNQVRTLDNGYIIHQVQINKAQKLITSYLNKNHQATVTELKQLLETTRRYIMPIINYFDENGLLIRDGDFRKLIQSSKS